MDNFTGALRVARIEDADDVLAIEQATRGTAHWPAERYLDAIRDRESSRKVLVVESHDEPRGICGFAVLRLVHGECEIENIAISNAMQRRGVGYWLLAGVVDEARNLNALRVLLEVRSGNTAAIALYLKCGFQLDGVRKGYYSDPTEDALLFSLSLKNAS